MSKIQLEYIKRMSPKVFSAAIRTIFPCKMSETASSVSPSSSIRPKSSAWLGCRSLVSKCSAIIPSMSSLSASLINFEKRMTSAFSVTGIWYLLWYQMLFLIMFLSLFDRQEITFELLTTLRPRRAWSTVVLSLKEPKILSCSNLPTS